MAELNNKKLVNAEALAKVAKGVYEQVQADIDAVEEQIAEVNVFEPGMGVTMKEVGGVAAGTKLDGLTVQEVLAKIFYPHTKPVVGSVNTTPTASNVIFEFGDVQTVTQVQAKVTKKSKPITKVELLKGSTVLATKEEMPNGGTATFAGLSEEMGNGEKFTVKAYALNEAGTAEESTSASSSAFTYVYPYYHGVVADGVEITGDVVKGLTKTIKGKSTQTFKFTTNNSKVVYAFPKSYGVLSSIKDQNNLDASNSFAHSEMEIVGKDGTSQTYIVYVTKMPSSVSDYGYTFNN